MPETAYFNAIREIGKQAACAFQHTPIVQDTNFPKNQLDAFVATFNANGVVMGAPDVWMNDTSIDEPYGAYSKYDDVFLRTGIAATVAMNNFEVPSRDEEEKKLAGVTYQTNAEWNPAYLGTAAPTKCSPLSQPLVLSLFSGSIEQCALKGSPPVSASYQYLA